MLSYLLFNRNCASRWGLTVVEPIPEAVEPILNQVFRGSEVEPRIDCFENQLRCSRNSVQVLRGMEQESEGVQNRGQTFVYDALESYSKSVIVLRISSSS
jgi:hypothetical protein